MTSEINQQQSSVLKRDLSSLTLAQRIKLKKNSPVLLLDVSASMNLTDDLIYPKNKKRIEKLRDIVNKLDTNPDIYYFSNDIGQCTKDNIPNPISGTNLGKALNFLSISNRKKVVIITDGEVSDPLVALDAVKDMHIDIIYVGGPDKPPFLDELAKKAGGKCNVEDLNMTKELAGKLDVLLLTAGIEDIKL